MSRRTLARRRRRLVVAMAVATVAGAGLTAVGTSVVRNSTAGRYVNPTVGPDEPGYQAYVVATPTLAVVQADEDGELASVAVLSLHPGERGGAVTLVPPSMLVPDPADEDAGAGEGEADGDAGAGEGPAGRGAEDEGAAGDGSGTGATGEGPTGTGASTGTDAPAGTGEGPGVEQHGGSADGAGTGGDATDEHDGAGGGDGGEEASVGDTTVADAYAAGGADAAVDAVGLLLGVAVHDVVELGASDWPAWVEPTGPVTLTLAEDAGPWSSGEVTLTAEEVAGFLLDEVEGEPEPARARRHAAFWDAWVASVAEAGPEGLPGDPATGLARFVAALSRDVSAEVVPVEPVGEDGPGSEGGPGLMADEVAMSELIARAVPYPLSPAPGHRVRVRLLNGTTDPTLTAEVVPLLVAAGAEITIAGNAASFDVTETTYAYADRGVADDAERLAESVGVGRLDGDGESVATEPTGGDRGGDAPPAEAIEDEIDITIVLGADVQDLIRRLESSG